ncbi:MAG: hypothetical protein Fur0039_27040 [Rhodocyclaceae bacterium]
MRPTTVLLLGLLAQSALAADIYSWRDKDGRIHYSDVPPPAPIQPRSLGAAGPAPSPPAPATAARSRPADLELEFRKRRAQAAEAEAKLAKEKSDAEAARMQCEQARRYLATIESGRRIAQYNSAGELEFLDDAQRAASLEQARAGVASWCK